MFFTFTSSPSLYTVELQLTIVFIIDSSVEYFSYKSINNLVYEYENDKTVKNAYKKFWRHEIACFCATVQIQSYYIYKYLRKWNQANILNFSFINYINNYLLQLSIEVSTALWQTLIKWVITKPTQFSHFVSCFMT